MSAINTPTKEQLDHIYSICDSIRFVSQRVEILRNEGFDVHYGRMGSGGKKQIKEMKNDTRVQIGYGTGRQNYAYYVSFAK